MSSTPSFVTTSRARGSFAGFASTSGRAASVSGIPRAYSHPEFSPRHYVGTVVYSDGQHGIGGVNGKGKGKGKERIPEDWMVAMAPSTRKRELSPPML